MLFNPSNYDWFCDSCDSYLNDQYGFTDENDTWTCIYCGCENSLTEDNIFSGFITQYNCPFCNGHMRRNPSNFNWYICEECDEELELDTSTNEFILEYNNDDDVPEGCAACGGPYPDCTSSCPLFDD